MSTVLDRPATAPQPDGKPPRSAAATVVGGTSRSLTVLRLRVAMSLPLGLPPTVPGVASVGRSVLLFAPARPPSPTPSPSPDPPSLRATLLGTST